MHRLVAWHTRLDQELNLQTYFPLQASSNQLNHNGQGYSLASKIETKLGFRMKARKERCISLASDKRPARPSEPKAPVLVTELGVKQRRSNGQMTKIPSAPKHMVGEEVLRSDSSWQKQRLACLSLLPQGKQHGH